MNPQEIFPVPDPVRAAFDRLAAYLEFNESLEAAFLGNVPRIRDQARNAQEMVRLATSGVILRWFMQRVRSAEERRQMFKFSQDLTGYKLIFTLDDPEWLPIVIAELMDMFFDDTPTV